MNSGIILAAGRGSRMKNLTEQVPKCLLQLDGKALLEWQLAALRAAGLDRLLVVRGYAAQCITGDFETAENLRWQQTNMLATLLCADDFVQKGFSKGIERVVVSYSDIVYHPDHVRALLSCRNDIAITCDTDWQALWTLRFGDPLLDAESFHQENGLLEEIGGRPTSLDDVRGQYMGLLSFNRSGWACVKAICAELGMAVDKMDMTAFLRLLLAKKLPIGVVNVYGKWCEADSEKDLELYRQALATGNWSHDWRWL